MPQRNKKVPNRSPKWKEEGYGTRFQSFQNLMRFRIRDILIVSSLYDLYVFEEDGHLYEMIRDKFEGLNLTNSPELTQVSSGREALAMLKEERPFDLIITTLHIEDMSPAGFAKKIHELGFDIPVVMLAFDNKELQDMLVHHEVKYFARVFIWQGDFRLILGIIKSMEDSMNVAHDTDHMGVQSILVIEDNILYYSSLLPMIYTETMKQTQRLIEEGMNLSHKRLRMRARPKIILCQNYEEAWTFFKTYEDTILGIVSDIDFPRKGESCDKAGLIFAKAVKKRVAGIPILLNSTNPNYKQEAERLHTSFILKDSPTQFQELRQFMQEQLSFGDFIFMTPEGREVGRAHDLLSLEQAVQTVPEESIVYHSVRNHFSNWLKARTEFWLAHELRPRKVTDYDSVQETRDHLAQSLRDYRHLRQRGLITDFKKDSFDPESSMSRIGGGSLGGKARGLSFVNQLVTNFNVENKYKDVRIYIPPTLVLGTEIFDRYMDANNLRDLALSSDDDQTVLDQFEAAKFFPEMVTRELADFLDLVKSPIAVRSSSLLEDSHVHPFAGVYRTYMLPNAHPDPFVRVLELIQAIKKVYASTFLKSSKHYMKVTPYRLEEEKMAIVVQKMIGTRHGDRFYPTFAGVAKSYNFYPMPPQTCRDGIASVALGLGKTVVEGGRCVRFCPKYPQHVNQASSVKDFVQNAQNRFYALDLSAQPETHPEKEDHFLKKYSLQTAESDGTLSPLVSTYSPENDRIVDGMGREGLRIVSFSPLLKNRLFPISEILDQLLDLGSWGMGTPVEIEFAVNLNPEPGQPKEFGILQMRPIVLNRELEVMDIHNYQFDDLICQTTQVLGNDILDNIYDIVLVDREKFDRAKSRAVADEVRRMNNRLIDAGRPYLLIGVGRWGSLDPWLGIPVAWDEIAGARAIVEAGFKDIKVEPSQGSHFFQNLNSFQVGYFTIQSENSENHVDWKWLLAQPAVEELMFTRHLRFEKPVIVKMSAHQSRGVILKPETN